MSPRNNSQAGFFGRHRGLIIGLAIIAAVIVLAAFISLQRSDVPVRMAQVRRGDIRATIFTNGKITPVQPFEAHAAAPALVKRVLVREGDPVKAGQLLVELDTSEAQAEAAKALAELRAAEASMTAIQAGGTREEILTTQADLVKARTDRDAAQRNLAAMRRLQQEGAASLGEVQDAENQLQRADAEINMLQQKLQGRYSRPQVEQVQAQEEQGKAAYQAAQNLLHNSIVRAPTAGIVYSLPVHAGSFVNTGDLLVEVANLSTVEVHAYIDEPDIARLNPGEKVNLTWDAMPGRHWQGTVTRLPAQIVKYQTRNVGEVVCLVPNPGDRLLPNTNVNVTIITAEHRDVLTVPREAVRIDGKAW
ncbi:MAG TPA: efflux RND transporter periplasmic adaptor subunit, partial [Terriglobales bacterium]|nr:efflux RND transporter periplasmic adaptor subunit [Terriglobales bacterium]